MFLNHNQDTHLKNYPSLRSLNQNISKNSPFYSNSQEKKRRYQNRLKNQLKLNQLQAQNSQISQKYLSQLNEEYYKRSETKNNCHQENLKYSQKNQKLKNQGQQTQQFANHQNTNLTYWKNRLTITKRENQNKREQKHYLTNCLKKAKKNQKNLQAQYQKILTQYQVLTQFLSKTEKNHQTSYSTIFQNQANFKQNNQEIYQDIILQAKMTQQTIDDQNEQGFIFSTPQYMNKKIKIQDYEKQSKNLSIFHKKKGQTIKRKPHNQNYLQNLKKIQVQQTPKEYTKAKKTNSKLQEKRLSELQEKFQSIIQKFNLKNQGKCNQQTAYLDKELFDIGEQLNSFRLIISSKNKAQPYKTTTIQKILDQNGKNQASNYCFVQKKRKY